MYRLNSLVVVPGFLPADRLFIHYGIYLVLAQLVSTGIAGCSYSTFFNPIGRLGGATMGK